MQPLFLALFIFLTCSGAWAQKIEPVLPVIPETAAEVVDILPVGARLLGEQEENGVLATAWLYRTSGGKEADFPFILFVRFIGSENNILVEKGLVAFKVEDKDGHRETARKMNFKSGYFAAGLSGVSRGRQALLIGCKLEDEKKRQYRFALQ